MAARKNIERNQKELDSLLEDSYIKVDSPLSRRFSRIKWIRKGTLRKITHIINDGKDGMDYEDTVTARIAAAYWLNGYWSIRFLHWAVWRWMWRRYSEQQLRDFCEFCKKKVQLRPYYENMISQIGLKDTLMTMTRKEIEGFLREHQSAQPASSQRNSPSSSGQDTSSSA